MQLLNDLRWRYATKRFDADREVPREQIERLAAAVNLAPSSYGLQPYQLLIISDSQLKEKLRTLSYDQPQITECSHLFVFCHKLNMSADYVDAYIELMAETREMPVERVAGFGEYIKSSVLKMSEDTVIEWNRRQTYIALGTLLAAAAQLRVDTCPMEGFEADGYDDVLGLKARGLGACVIAAVGYRAEIDQTQYSKKVRRDVVEFVGD